MTNETILRLRPHHLLCLLKYTGHGYDERFTDHMNRIAEILKNNPDTAVQIIKGPDELCAMCPNLKRGICVSEEKVRNMDRAASAVMNVRSGNIRVWKELMEKAQVLFEACKEDAVCKDCSWAELCKNIERGIING